MASLLAAFDVAYGGEIVLGYGLRNVQCADRWATAWTDPDANDPDAAEPTPVLFEVGGDGTWRAIGAGEDNGCLRDVPQQHWDALACY